MLLPNSVVYFVDAYTPNEGEPEYSLEYAILRWCVDKSERPEVYVHTYLRPEAPVHRIRWPNAQSYMKIDRSFIEGNDNLPTLANMIEEDYLNNKMVVCFDASLDPFYDLVGGAIKVESIVQTWNTLYSDDEKALSCDTIDKMCEYIGMLPDNNDNTNYTPLLKRLTKMAALWSLLVEVEKNPKCKPNFKSGGMQFNFVWPLPPSEENWFDPEPQSLSELTKEQIVDFFNTNLADKINWFKMSMYACDWVYRRRKRAGADDLVGKKELADFVFNKVLNFKMQMWVLIFYSLYFQQKEDACDIAISNGDLRQLSPVSLEKFTDFIIDNLDVFLNSYQKNCLLASLVHQSLDENVSCSFEHYDYANLKKHSSNNHHLPKLFFNEEFYKNNKGSSYKEILNSDGKSIYRLYELKGYGKDRGANIDFIVRKISKLYNDAHDVFSPIWLNSPIKLWIQFITGVDYKDISSSANRTDSEDLIEIRKAVKKIIEHEAYNYMLKLYEQLETAVTAIRAGDVTKSPICFNFQGCSVEIVISSPNQGLFKRLISFN